MSTQRDPEKGLITTTESPKPSLSSSTSSSDSNSSSTSSPVSTPPSEESPPQLYVQPQPESHPEPLPRIHHAPHSATPPRRGRRSSAYASPSARLGAIDEHSNSVAPDIPTRNPARKYVGFYLPASTARLFGFGGSNHTKSHIPPPNAYDSIVGPRGEKFADVRKNRDTQRSPSHIRRTRRRKMSFVALAILLVLLLALAVGLGVGLTRKNRSQSHSLDATDDNTPSDSSTTDPQPFPLGAHNIPTYLTNTSTLCTSNAATWRCYPYTTYSTSPTTAFSSLRWRITSPKNDTTDMLISNTNPTFSYPFTDVPLTLTNAVDRGLSAYTFDVEFRKQVVPDADVTGDNGAVRCYYDGTRLSARLYSDALGAGGGILEGPAKGEDDWPFAIEYEETIRSGPECWRYVNGLETERVDIEAGTGECSCSYKNFGLN